MGTGESDTNVGTDAGTGEPGEGSTGSTSSGWGNQNQGEDARQPGTGAD
jgi:hypothetical protein